MSRKPETKGFKRGFIPLDLKTTESQAEKSRPHDGRAHRTEKKT